MEPTIAVYFDLDRTFIALMEPDSKGQSLAYVNSTTRALDLASGKDAAGYADAHQELQDTLLEIAGAAFRITVSVPMESVFVHQFPAPAALSTEEIQKLVRFEIDQHFPDENPEHFESQAFQLCPRLDESQMMQAVIMDRDVRKLVEESLQILGGNIERIEVAQHSAHNAFVYSYPEVSDKTVFIIGIQRKYLDVSVLKNGQAAYYQIVPFNSNDEIPGACETELRKVLEEYVPYVDEAYIFGAYLLNDILQAIRSELSIPVHRFNAFRMITTTLGERERSYCSRVAHVFPPCIGSALSQVQEGIRI